MRICALIQDGVTADVETALTGSIIRGTLKHVTRIAR